MSHNVRSGYHWVPTVPSEAILFWLQVESGLVLIVLLTVSSFQMALTCVKNMTAVKMAKRRLSKMRKSKRTTVAGGEKEEHCRHSLLTQITNW